MDKIHKINPLNQLVYESKYFPLFRHIQNMNSAKQFFGEIKKCRFCEKKHPEVTFRNTAHAIPESVGNKRFISIDECDCCNNKFGRYFEDDFAKFINVFNTASQIPTKDGVPSYKSSDNNARIDYSEKGVFLQEKQDSGFTKIGNGEITLSFTRQPYIPLAVYKTFVKMALSLLPNNLFEHFRDTSNWLLEENHQNSNYDMSRYTIMIERFVPGPRPLPLIVNGFIRKDETDLLPYYQLVVEAGNHIYQVAVPCRVKDFNLNFVKHLNIYPFPHHFDIYKHEFGNISTNISDFSSCERVKDDKIPINFHFDECIELDVKGLKVDELFEKEGINTKKRLLKKQV